MKMGKNGSDFDDVITLIKLGILIAHLIVVLLNALKGFRPK